MLRIGIDIGGTFTDFAAWREGSGEIVTAKVPSTPPDFAEGFKTGFEEVALRLKPRPGEAVTVMHGTTVSTNTVIERSGPPIVMLTTAGFGDLMELQRLRLSRSMDIHAGRVPPLVPRERVIEIRERLDADGSVLEPIDLAAVATAARAARDAGAEGIAVAFMHSYRNPVHERAAGDTIATVVPDIDVTLSSDIWPRIGEYERATACVLNAYVRRRMDRYLQEIEAYLAKRLAGARLFVTRSNGGAMAAAQARRFPVHTLLSGPASGVTAAVSLGRAVGEERLLTMDMGGTSTDIALIREGRPTVSTEAEVGDFPLIMPVTGIEAIGAGGGSIVRMEGRVLRVGPGSAGARPGPACFGRGGERPTVTDAYLLCGYINPDNFLGGRMRLDRFAAERAMGPVAAALGTGLAEAAEAAVTVATSTMVARVLPYLARHGVDPENLTLVLYGGAGALHGPLLAGEIGIARVLVPAIPSVFCAYGGLVSDLVHDTAETVHGRPMDPASLRESLDRLEAVARAWLAEQVDAERVREVRLEHWAEMRYRGQSFQIDVALPATAARGDLDVVEAAFHAEHERLYAHSDPAAPFEIIEFRVRIHGTLAAPRPASRPRAADGAGSALVGRRTLRIGGRDHADAGIYDRGRLGWGHRVAGPALIEQEDAAILVPPRFGAEVDRLGNVIIAREA